MAREMFIVGGSSGIGLATVKKFCKEGFSVTNLSRTPCNCEGVENILCDVSNGEALAKLLEDYKTKKGRLSAFVYSAGFSMAAPLEYAEDADFRYLFEVNFFGFVACLKRLLPILKGGGRVCVVSSVGGIQPIAYDCFYSASKAAVNMLAFALQQELLNKDVKIVSVMPGGTRTKFTFRRKVYPREKVGEYADEMFSAVKTLHNIEQKGAKPEKVAETIYRCCVNSPLSDVKASGFLNKLIFFLSRFMPQSLDNYILSKIYFGK